MKIVSELTGKEYKTVDECLQAEKEHQLALKKAEDEKKALKEKRAARAKEVEDAYKAVQEAQKRYNELVDKFVNDYGSFHMSVTTRNHIPDFFWPWSLL